MFGIFRSFLAGNDTDLLRNSIKHNACLLDVRSESEFNAGSCKGAINIPVDQIENQLEKLKNQQQIVVFCRSGMRSNLAEQTLRKHGLNNVINVGTVDKIKKILNL